MLATTAAAFEGFNAPASAPCPYIATSDCADAWWIGRAVRHWGAAPELAEAPRRVARSRGHSMRIESAGSVKIVTVDYEGGRVSIRTPGGETLWHSEA